MNLIDRAAGWISPKWQYERKAWRQASNQIRNYDAGADDRLNASWRNVTTGTAEQTDVMYRDTLRTRARDLERNSDMAESIILAFEKNIVGSGFKLQATTDDEILNSKIEELFKEWCKARNCDVTVNNHLMKFAGWLFVERKSTAVLSLLNGIRLKEQCHFHFKLERLMT
nr:phage portal protein [Rummeliibacillus stabekisii]